MKTKLLLYLCVVVASIPIAALRTLRPEFLGTLCAFAICFLATYVILRKFIETSPSIILLIILAGIASIEILPRFVLSDGSAPTSVIDSSCRFIGVFGAYYFFKMRRIVFRIIYIVILSASVLWVSTIGTSFWLNKVATNTYTGLVNETIDKPITFLNGSGDTLGLNDLGSKYVILMTWRSDCGSCMGGGFPIVEDLYNQYKNSPKISVFSCLCLQEGDNIQTADSLAKKYGFEFPSLSAIRNSAIDSILNTSTDDRTAIFLILDTNGVLRGKASRHRIRNVLKQLSK